MRNRRRKTGAGTAKSMAGQWLGLSLFIMLLAFFIVLNAISTYQDVKVKPVLSSVGNAFSSRLEDEDVDEEPSVTEDEVKSTNEGTSLDRLEALFKAQIPSHEVIVNQSNGTMYVKTTLDEFERAVMAAGQRPSSHDPKEDNKFLKGFFLPTLISLMNMDENNLPYRMDIILNIDENPARLQNQHPKRLALIMKKIGRLAGKIEAGGLPTKLMSIGLQKGEENSVEIFFRRHVAFNPMGPDEDEQ